MKRDGMKIGLLMVLVAACGVLFYNQFVRTSERTQSQLTPDEVASFEHQERQREIRATLPGYEEGES